MASSLTETQTGIVGIETLLGREVKDVVETRGLPGKLHAFAGSGDEPEIKKKPEPEAEEVALEPLSAKALSGLSAVVLTGLATAASEVYDLAKAAGKKPAIIDCLGHLESRPEARIAAPIVIDSDARADWLFVVAHPVATALTLVLARLMRYRGVRASVVNVFEPASERGKPGVSELSQQTTALLTFKKLDKAVFDAQVSFNVLPRVGEDSEVQLLSTEARIDRHLATLLSRQEGTAAIPMPSLRVVQVPVFHGYSISIWVEFDTDVQVQAIEEALASAQIEIRSQDEEPPDNVGAVSQSGLIAGDIRIDRNNSRAAWIWVAMDNLRMVADVAADLLRVIPPRQSSPIPGGAVRPPLGKRPQ